MTFSKAEQIAEVRRVLDTREKLFPSFVAQGRMAADEAAAKIAVLVAIIASLESLPDAPPAAPTTTTDLMKGFPYG